MFGNIGRDSEMNNWLQNNNVIRIISFLIALSLWFLVSQKTEQEPRNESIQTQKIEVSAEYDQDQYELVQSTKEVKLTLSGNPALIGYSSSRVRAYIDVTGLGIGTHTKVPIKVSGVPSGIKKTITPSTMSVTIRKKEKKTFPVEVWLQDQAGIFYQVTNALVEPPNIVASGVTEKLRSVTSIRAYAKGNETGYLQKLPLRAFANNNEVPDIQLVPKEVNVRLTNHLVSKEVPIVPVLQTPKSKQIERIEFNPKKIRLLGDRKVLSKIRRYELPFTISDQKGDQRVRVGVPIRPGVIKVEPNEIEIYVKMRHAYTKLIENIPLQLLRVGQGLEAQVMSPKNITVTISGTSKQIENYGTNHVQAVVDVSGLPVGSHQVPIEIVLPQGISLVKQSANSAIVEIRQGNQTTGKE